MAADTSAENVEEAGVEITGPILCSKCRKQGNPMKISFHIEICQKEGFATQENFDSITADFEEGFYSSLPTWEEYKNSDELMKDSY